MEAGPDGSSLSFEAIDFPKGKEEIEEYVLTQFKTKIEERGGKITFTKKNNENSFDFTVGTPNGDIFLELTEFVRLIPKASPYSANGTQVINIYEDAFRLFSTIKSKMTRYSSNSQTPIHLLVYVTHWAFVIDKITLTIVAHWIQKELPHPFEAVFLYIPLSQKDGDLIQLFPSKKIDGFDPEKYRDTELIIPDPANAILIQE